MSTPNLNEVPGTASTQQVRTKESCGNLTPKCFPKKKGENNFSEWSYSQIGSRFNGSRFTAKNLLYPSELKKMAVVQQVIESKSGVSKSE